MASMDADLGCHRQEELFSSLGSSLEYGRGHNSGMHWGAMHGTVCLYFDWRMSALKYTLLLLSPKRSTPGHISKCLPATHESWWELSDEHPLVASNHGGVALVLSLLWQIPSSTQGPPPPPPSPPLTHVSPLHQPTTHHSLCLALTSPLILWPWLKNWVRSRE